MRLLSVNVGHRRTQPKGPDLEITGIYKRPTDGPVTVTARLIGYKLGSSEVTLTGGSATADFALADNPLQLGEVVHTDETTAREGIPPSGSLAGLDLVTEGILTLARTLEFVEASNGDPDKLPADHNAAVLLSKELLRADSVLFLAGESVNP